MTHRARALLALAPLALVGAAAGQTKIGNVWGPHDWANFGHSVAVVGDVDNDGGDDYWVGAPGGMDALGLVTGTAYLISGKTSEVLRSTAGLTEFDYYGSHLASIGDVDGDGEKDLLIGATQILYVPYKSGWQNPSGNGYVEVRSGRTAELIRTHAGLNFGFAYGASGCGIGDVDGDLVEDYAIGEPRGTTGQVFVHSGATGALLRVEVPSGGAAGVRSWGFWVAPHVDVNGDNVPDHLVSAVPFITQMGSFGVTCVSGADGSELWSALQPSSTNSDWGYRSLSIDDLTSDGIPEVVIGTKRANQYVGFAAWVDGATGVEIKRSLGYLKSETMGASLELLGDLDGDGVAEVAVGSPSQGVPYGFAARGLRIYSGLSPQPKWLIDADPLHSLSFGTALGRGDFNGDGQTDVVIGSPNEDVTYLWQGGRVEVFTDLLGP